jgi:fatty acid desaturase
MFEAAAFAVLLFAPEYGSRSICLLILSFATVQGAYLAHEVAHGAIMKNKLASVILGQLFMTVWVGYCYNYFRRSHNLHHYHSNEDGCDPDTEANLVAVHGRSAQEKRGFYRFTTAYQTIIIPFLYLLWAFDLKIDSIAYTLRNWRRNQIDLAVFVLHVLLWFLVPVLFLRWEDVIINYIIWTMLTGVYFGLTVTVNHTAMQILSADHKLSFFEQQVVTSRNISGHVAMDLIFAGMNWQIEHHLFPFVPSTRLRRGGQITKDFCKEQGLPYHEVSFRAAMREVWQHLARMARLTREVSAGYAGPQNGSGGDALHATPRRDDGQHHYG